MQKGCNINTDAENITSKNNIKDKIKSIVESNAFITLKDHKKNPLQKVM